MRGRKLKFAEHYEKIQLVETKSLIAKIIESGVVNYGGPYFNSENIRVLNSVEDLNFIPMTLNGCYFIFSTIPVEKLPIMSVKGSETYQKNCIEKDGQVFRCLYNGKGDVKGRLKLHLFNPFTPSKIEGTDQTISGTGAMSLNSLPQSKFDELEAKKQYYPEKHKLKPVRKSIQPESHDQREGHAYFLNGIDITEEPWNQYKFAIVVLDSDSEFGKILVEEAFCEINGRPPLCKRHG